MIFWYSNGKSTVYEPNTPAAHDLLRSGKYVQVAEQRCGRVGREILSFLLQIGHASVGEIVQACHQEGGSNRHEITSSQPVSSGKPAPAKLKENTRTPLSEAITPEDVYHALVDLLSTGHLHRTHESFFRTQADNHDEAQKLAGSTLLGRNHAKISKKEQAETLEMETQTELDTWRYGTTRERRDLELLRNMRKRSLDGDVESRPAKRMKINGTSGLAPAQQDTQPEEATLLHDYRLKVIILNLSADIEAKS